MKPELHSGHSCRLGAERADFPDVAARPQNPFTPFGKLEIEQTLPARFAKQVARHGNRTAVLTPLRAWTYAELEAWADRIANALLQRRGPGSEPVVLFLEQGASLVAAILGVLKAGKFYVPMDPVHPFVHNQAMAPSVGAKVVLADKTSVEIARALWPQPEGVIDLDSLPARVSAECWSVALSPFAPAYVFFTSGSTGRPKGVVDNHRNVLHNVLRYTNALHVCPEDRLTLVQSGTFSGTVSSLFSALLNGACLLPFDVRREGFLHLADWMKQARATIYHSVPAIFRGVVEARQNFPDIRVVRLEGDHARRSDFEMFCAAFPDDSCLANGLGTTETGLCRQFFANKKTVLVGDNLPIGYAVPDVETELIGENGAPVGPGEVGEIVVRSEFLATGYWRNDKLTREKFRPDTTDGRRVYHLGDLGRMRADGCLEYLSRRNFEYKVSGQWVDTGAIERALSAVGGVSDAALVTQATEAGDPRLVAYFVVKAGATVSGPQLRQSLAGKLPAAMIPTAFVALPSLPLSEHGKVDRAALRALPCPRAERVLAFVAPETPAERAMAAIWEEILGVSPIGLNENFFDLGGDSLRAARLTAKLEKQLARPIAPGKLLETPTIEQFLRLIPTGDAPAHPVSPLIALQPAGASAPFFCVDAPGADGWPLASFAQKCEQQPFYCLASCGLIEPWPPGVFLEEMAAEVIRQIRGVQPTGPLRLGGNCYGGVVAFEATRQLRARGGTVDLVLFAVSPRDFPTLLDPEICRRFFANEARARRARRRTFSAGPGTRDARFNGRSAGG